ncbi:substrate-binding periplasmic protein [Kiloniella sp.]|uniref:substrate-binding periplasmic protein n=1 Tax=Kiloniella sp. TaxID=1938587 RepID=UPI003A956FAD
MNFFRIILAIIFLGAFSPATASENTGSLRLCYENRAQPPYYMGDDAVVPLHQRGVYVDILAKVAAELGIWMQLVRRPWKRCLRLLELNEVDGVLGVSYLAEREAIGRYPRVNGALDHNARLAMKSYSFYVRRDHQIPWKGVLSEVEGYSVGVPLGYAISSRLVKAGVKVSEQSHTEFLLEMLKHKRIEAVTTLAGAGDFQIREDPERYKDIVKLSPSLQAQSYHLLIGYEFYADNREMVERIWDLIPSYRTEINAKYGITD